MSDSSKGVRAWRRVVVKVGTSTLTAGTGKLNAPRMVDLCRQIAEAHDGSVTLANRADRSGCVARVTFPRA